MSGSLKSFIVATLLFFTLIGRTSDVYAAYVGYGTAKYQRMPWWHWQFDSAMFYLESVDWDDARPLPCLRSGNNSLCTLQFQLVFKGFAWDSWYPMETHVYADDLRKAKVRTIGEYLRYLRDTKNVNIIKAYSLPGQYKGNAGDPWNDQNTFCFNAASLSSGNDAINLVCAIRAVPETAGCDIQESQISIDHGALSANALNGHTATGELTVRCDGNGSAMLMAANPNPKLLLAPDGSLFTTLTVGGKPLVQGVVVNAGPGGGKVTLTSTLGTAGSPGAGQFSGSAVVVLSMQ